MIHMHATSGTSTRILVEASENQTKCVKAHNSNLYTRPVMIAMIASAQGRTTDEN